MNVAVPASANYTPQDTTLIISNTNLDIKEFENLSVEIKTLPTRPGLESQRSRKRLFFDRKIFKFFNI